MAFWGFKGWPVFCSFNSSKEDKNKKMVPAENTFVHICSPSFGQLKPDRSLNHQRFLHLPCFKALGDTQRERGS